MDFSKCPKMELEFVSYSGKYPNLCRGVLIMSFNGELFEFPHYCLSSGGECSFANGDEVVTNGEWEIRKWPEGFPEYLKPLATKLVNENVEQGCCGGCL